MLRQQKLTKTHTKKTFTEVTFIWEIEVHRESGIIAKKILWGNNVE
jgi:hypothetical protein